MRPINGKSLSLSKVSRGNDEAVDNIQKKVLLEKKQPAMVQLVQDLGKFFKKKEKQTNSN